MRLFPVRGVAVAFAAALSCSTSAMAAPLLTESFATNPFNAAATSGWFGAQHGIARNSLTLTFAHNGGNGSDGLPGFAGYSPANRANVSLIYEGVNWSLDSLTSASIDARHSATSGDVRFGVRVGSTWYLTDNAQSATSGNWTTLNWLLTPGTLFREASVNPGGPTPRELVGAAGVLAGNSTVNAIAFWTSWSGINTPNSGFVLRYDNVNIQGVPEPLTMTLLGAGLLAAAVRRRRH